MFRFEELNFIGDIHGSDSWKKLVRSNAINVFLGDYLDTRDAELAQTQETNLLEILHYKLNNPDNVILLLANHDLQYLYLGRYNDMQMSSKSMHYHSIFIENKDLFSGVAYAYGNYLVTHAGVSALWYERYFGEYNNESAEELAAKLNNLFEENLDAYRFDMNKYYVHDWYGEDEHQSPVWIRPKSLINFNLLKDTEIVQIVGHTHVKEIHNHENKIVFIDCLRNKTDSYVVKI